MHNVLPLLAEPVKKQIVAGILFGDTKNKQSNASVEGISKDQLLSLCAQDDGVCWGALSVTAGHVVYTQDGSVDKAAKFLIEKVDKVLGAKPVAAKAGRRRSVDTLI
jgi:cutinase